MKPLTILAASLTAVALIAQAAPPSSFSTAKRLAENRVYHDQSESFYCNCDFTFEGGPDLASCGYQVRKQPKRAARIEWEHVMPAYDIGRQRQCWQEGGRDHCRATDPTFRSAEADLHNLVPSVGEVNGDRSNLRYGMATSAGAYQYGQCNAMVDFGEDVFQPPANQRGNVARIYWYMRDEYGIRISRQQEQLFRAWAKQDPIDAWERERNRRIAAIQGHGNPYVSNEALRAQAILPVEPAANDPILPVSIDGFNCSSRKTCGAMASCAEAIFHLKQCGNGRLDGDDDGTPCEAICR
ncbi:deoxyribonuclease-1 [Modicisalibacter muralis]|uniref:Deoxyribonuclease-1 n=1 Tax=Modicisalibacter muralis TaxID=119000 RepID=A0A1G9EQ55_9GAMM|nr:endonuclease [Halomonas muralis]SDK78145.1 deoxyribonuclease-1 [Halomonas muralis]